MKPFKLALCLLLAGLTAQAALERHSWGIEGAHRGYRGSSVWIRPTTQFFHTFSATFNSTTDEITAPGNNFVVGSTVLFFPAVGSALPVVLNPELSYKVCSKTGDNIRIALNLLGSCNKLVDLGDTGAGTILVGSSVPSGTHVDHVYLSNPVLPPGVTIGACLAGGTAACFWKNGAYWSYGGEQAMWIRLDISPTAALGPAMLSFTMHCNTGKCPDEVLSTTFTVEHLTPLTVNPPKSYPPVNKSAWESQMLARAAQWCPDKSKGVINWAPFPAFSFGSTGENQVWYYDSAWAYHQIADYTGDAQWRNCAKAISKSYAQALIMANGQFSTFHRYFSDGLVRSYPSPNSEGAAAAALVWEKNALGGIPSSAIRETSYALEAGMSLAKMKGWKSFQQIQDAAMKSRIQQKADLLWGALVDYKENPCAYFQSFMAGLGMRAALEWYEYSGDERMPLAVKDLVDVMAAEMYGNDPANPNEIAWMRGIAAAGSRDQGPTCGYNCSPFAAAELQALFVPAWAFLWQRTGNDVYRQQGDAIWATIWDRNISYSGKIFGQCFRWSFDYVAWREGRQPNRP